MKKKIRMSWSKRIELYGVIGFSGLRNLERLNIGFIMLSQKFYSKYFRKRHLKIASKG
ncbi:MAG TPA: hypothetical protein PKD70_10880 [Saprospiraceae bacterium]|nr:hypothetical protein [Saprospiraceae bacterium]